MPTHEVEVTLYGKRAGRITRSGGRVQLQYAESYRDDSTSTPLSLSMPLTSATHRRRQVMAYLDGLLPDHEGVRARWARRHGTKPGDVLSLIAALGQDVAGAARFSTSGTPAVEPTLQPISDAAIARRIRRLREDGADWETSDDASWSLAGAQSKFTLAAIQGPEGIRWAVASGSEPSTHIVKPGITRLPDQALVEHVSMRALGRLGLAVARTEYIDFDGEPALVVERYDRRLAGGGQSQRVHQEDLLQALALMPGSKYEADGGPGLRDIGALLTRVDPAGRERFASAIIGNYLLGAPDAHAKNYALLLLRDQARLAPLYDIASGLPYRDGESLRYPTVAMSIGGERRIGALEERHWVKAADTVGTDPDWMLDQVRAHAVDMPAAVAEELDHIDDRAACGRLRTSLLPRLERLASDTRESLRTRRTPRWAETRADSLAREQPRRGKGLDGGRFMQKPKATSGTFDDE